MIRISILSIAFVVAAAVAAAQQFPPQPPPAAMNQGNDRERAACHPDVTRFCQTQLQVNPMTRWVFLDASRPTGRRLAAPANKFSPATASKPRLQILGSRIR